MLELEGLRKSFGGLIAVADAEFYIDEGEIVGLIGPNGAGKTTIFNLVSGTIRPTSGTIRFKGEDVTNMKPHVICRRSMARTFQSVNLFPQMSVLENTLIGALFGASTGNINEARKKGFEQLAFVGLSGKENWPAGELSVPEQKRLEIARALATEPELLLLDEVMAGLNSSEVVAALSLIKEINARGITILMIEHIMHAIMGVSDRIIVLHYGRKLAEGTPEEISQNKEVIEVYLGE
jgi:branched-chain amino acid transport system ATP-binding protein